MTLSSADTHEIAKYARTYIRDTHTHTHTHKKQNIERLEPKKKGKKVGKTPKKRGGVKKERKKKKQRTKRKWGK